MALSFADWANEVTSRLLLPDLNIPIEMATTTDILDRIDTQSTTNNSTFEPIGSAAAAIADMPYGYARRHFRTGGYYGPGPNIPAAATVGQSTLNLSPFWVPETFTADRVACEVTTLAAASTVRLGIYANDPATDVPTTVLLDAGTVDSTTTGVKEITISQELTPGLWWLAAVCQGGAPVMRGLGLISSPIVVPMSFAGSIATGGMNGYQMSAVTGALPTFAGNGVTTACIKVMVRAN